MSTVTVQDRIYGAVTISSPVLVTLIQSQPVQRLKGITQYGIPAEYYFHSSFSRYEHSIGTMLLLQKLQASEEEQIAGLLHDASHTAFSHVIDYVVGRYKKEDFQDSQHRKIITSTEIARILQMYGFDPERIANYKNFSLLESSLPDPCADRVDYSLREFPQEVIDDCLNAITTQDGKIIFMDKEAANAFAINYLYVQEHLWSYDESAIRYLFFSKALRIALKEKIITFADFWTDDATVMQKIYAAKESEISIILQTMKETKLLMELPKSKKIIYKKFRYIDPFIVLGGKLTRLSTIDPLFLNSVKKAQERNEKGVAIPRIL